MPERSVQESERNMSDRPMEPVEEVARMQEQMGNMSRKMEKPRKNKRKCEPFQMPPWPSAGPALFLVDGSPYAAALHVLVIVFNFIINSLSFLLKTGHFR